MKVVILGGGFASLKIATLISHNSKKEEVNVTLISSTKRFIFLPLIPNLLDKSFKKDSFNLFVNLEEFCFSRGIRFINHTVLEQDIQSEYLLVQGRKLDFDLLFDGRGKIDERNKGTYEFWDKFIHSVEAEPLEKDLIFKKPGIAEYEIIQALKSRSKNLNVRFIDSKKSFSSHPQLKNVYNRNNLKKIMLQSPMIIHINKNAMVKGKKVLLGGSLATILNCESTAQFASFTAKVGYRIFLQEQKNLSGNSASEYQIKKYRQRGKMLYVDSNDCYIWLGEDCKMGIKPHVKGRLGYFIREQFYLRQMQLFYSEKMPTKVINIYKFILNIFR